MFHFLECLFTCLNSDPHNLQSTFATFFFVVENKKTNIFFIPLGRFVYVSILWAFTGSLLLLLQSDEFIKP